MTLIYFHQGAPSWVHLEFFLYYIFPFQSRNTLKNEGSMSSNSEGINTQPFSDRRKVEDVRNKLNGRKTA